MKHKISKDILLGMAVGDALGVPVEFRNRSELDSDPVTGMQGYGTHNLPPGTWSDDSSLAFCLAESLCRGYDLDDIGRRFVRWFYDCYWTPHGRVFDIGIGTRRAIGKLKVGASPSRAGGAEETDNGNGSLMRILPLLVYIRHMPLATSVPIISEVSSLTHRHPRSILACVILLEFARLLCTHPKEEALRLLQVNMGNLLQANTEPRPQDFPELAAEWQHFGRILPVHGKGPRNGHNAPEEGPRNTHGAPEDDLRNTHGAPADIRKIPRNKIRSTGYVVHTLEAALWCIAKSTNYRDAVLMAVNLGDDTDTTAAVTGGLAGLAYGHDNIPQEWVIALARKDDIMELAERLDDCSIRRKTKECCPAG
jgi:ADP-ribosyl-[dinitrogen reductase] hydrolase